METPRRNSEKTAEGYRYRAPPAVMLFVGVSLVLWLLQGTAGSHKLSTKNLGLEKFFTSHLLHENGYHLTLTLLVFLIAGTILERRWRTPRFVAFYFFTAFGASLVTIITAWVAREPGASCGASAVALAALAAVGFHYPETKIVRWVPATKHLAWVLIFLGAAGLSYLDRRSQGWENRYFLFPQVSGVAFAVAFLALDPWFGRKLDRWRERRAEDRRHRVVKIRHRVDELLEKISTEGFESLTQDEQVFLRQASKHYKIE